MWNKFEEGFSLKLKHGTILRARDEKCTNSLLLQHCHKSVLDDNTEIEFSGDLTIHMHQRVYMSIFIWKHECSDQNIKIKFALMLNFMVR